MSKDRFFGLMGDKAKSPGSAANVAPTATSRPPSSDVRRGDPSEVDRVSRTASVAASAASGSLPVRVYQIEFGDASVVKQLNIPQVISVTPVVVENLNAIRIKGGAPDAPSFGAIESALSLRVSDEFEAAVSGKRLRAQLIVRAAGGADNADFFVAYSTNEVGNSGWVKLSAGSKFEPRLMEFDVPQMVSGNGDYFGLLVPDAPGIEVVGLRLEVMSSRTSS